MNWTSLKRVILSVFLAAGLLTSAQALTCVAVDENNMLYRFDSATPGTTTSGAITGLAMGYRVVGLDFRTTVRPSGAANPGVGSLWALATNGTTIVVYSVDPTTRAASFIGTLAGINASGSDNGWFFGFDPATDTLRVMNFIYNYSVNPNTLAVTADTQFNAPGVVNPNNFPALNGSAYTTASFGGTSQIYFLEQNNDGLNTSTNIAIGNYSAFPTPMNPAFATPAGLDVDGATMLMCGFNSAGGTNKQQLFSVNRTNGSFTLIGDISATPGTLSLRALAIQPASLPPAPSVVVKISGPKKVTTTAASRVVRGRVTSNIGVDKVEYRVGNSGKFRKARGTTNWKFTAKLKAGTNKVSVRAVKSSVTSKIARVTIVRQ